MLYGNLAPSGSIVKPAAVPDHLMTFTSKAKVFVSEDDAVDAILNGDIKENTVLVLAYEGPKGGPGTVSYTHLFANQHPYTPVQWQPYGCYRV